ncbi:hypothetical protein P3T26_004138 [Streptomyces sp. MAA16]|nr:hypothetical protein [Streptomyces sp. MAA16]
MPLPTTTFPVQEAARTSDGCAYVISSAFLKPPGVPSQEPIRQIAVALPGSFEVGTAMLLRVVVPPAVTATEVVYTASSPLKTVSV